MTDLADFALAAISQAQRRVEVAAQNLANVTTPAYKRQVPFAALVASNTLEASLPAVNTSTDFRSGKFSETGNPFDLAIAGPGWFALRREDQLVYSRMGRFTADSEGRLVTAQGFALQMTNGNDLRVRSTDFEIRGDGSVLEKGETLGRIAIFMADDESALTLAEGGFSAPATALLAPGEALVRQGVFEVSNVSTGDEMISILEALRRAESGQRVMTVYDDLMGRVITTFGENVR